MSFNPSITATFNGRGCSGPTRWPLIGSAQNSDMADARNSARLHALTAALRTMLEIRWTRGRRV